MTPAADSLDARILEVDRQLHAIIADAPPGRTIRLPQTGVTIKVGAGVAVEAVTACDLIPRPDSKPASLPDYSAIPEIDMDDFVRHVKDHPFSPTQEMLDEDWSDLSSENV